MTLDQVFTELAPSIVALGSRFITQPLAEGPDIPAIVGTGFVVDSSGLVLTAGHVAGTLAKEGHGPDGDPLACAMLYLPPEGKEGVEFHQINPVVPIVRSWQMQDFQLAHGPFYGERAPDIAMLQLGVRDLPATALTQVDMYFELESPLPLRVSL